MKGKRRFIRQTLKRGNGETDPYYLASCYGKIRYTKQGAKQRQDGISTMKFYKCKFGDHYQVGRKPWRQPPRQASAT